MNITRIHGKPVLYSKIEQKAREIEFSMPSDIYVGSLLKTLVASKPKGKILEIGTGIGLSLSWMIAGMDKESTLISLDNDSKLIAIAKDFFEKDKSVELICQDASAWIKHYKGDPFDLIFADAWPGKYSEIEGTLDLIQPGGFYIIDDMIKQPNWPDGHQENVDRLIKYLEQRKNFSITKLNWSTGIVIATKKA